MRSFSASTFLYFTLLCALLFTLSGRSVAAEAFEWHRFEVDGRKAFMILPKLEKRTESMPWVFYAPTFDRKLPSGDDTNEGWMFEKFLGVGIAIAGIDVGESYGSPEGREAYGSLYNFLTQEKSFGPKASLLARSRGGLMLYNWAAENPDKVQSIAGIYPVCDLRSYPGLAKACGAYGWTEDELKATLSDHNPVDRLAPLAKAKVPIFHIHGDTDTVVPLGPNTETVAKRYKALGGEIEVVIAKNQGHNMWRGFFHCEPLVAFVIKHATKNAEATPVGD